MIELRVITSPEVARRIRRAARNVPDTVGDALVKAGRFVEAEAKRLVSGPLLRRRTSRLARSITLRRRGKLEVELGPQVEYAAVHEFGRGPYTIVPKRAKVLRFTVGGDVVFARKVRHPGLRARAFMQTSVSNERNRIATVVGDAVSAVMRRV